MRWYPEKWLDGSNRDEFTAAQRGVWADLLSLGGRNDPPGQIDFTTIKSLARRLRISAKLLYATLKIASFNKKIRFIKVWVDPQSGKKFEEIERTLNEIDTFFQQKSKIGVPLNAIIFLDWNPKQPEYYRQKLYPKKNEQTNGKGQLLGQKNGDRIVQDRIVQDTDSIGVTFPSHPRDQFLYILKEFSKEYFYPFSEQEDGEVYDSILIRYRNVDPVGELEKKITYWKKNPEALKGKGKSPRQQLIEWLIIEGQYQNRASH